MCKETNRYAASLIVDPKYTKKKKLASWVDTTIGELCVFIVLVVIMGLVSKKRMVEYWSTDEIPATPFFGKIMNRRCYFQLLKVLHFVNNSSGNSAEDRLWKVRPIIDPLVSRYKSAFKSYKNLYIDESLLLWKGRLFFKHYVPTKHNRF